MAVWIKPDGRILCAAFNGPERGDLYIDDAEHGRLSEAGLLTTSDEGDTWTLAPGAVFKSYAVGPNGEHPRPATAALRIDFPHVWDVDGKPVGTGHEMVLDGEALVVREYRLDGDARSFVDERRLDFTEVVHALLNATPAEIAALGTERTMRPEIDHTAPVAASDAPAAHRAAAARETPRLTLTKAQASWLRRLLGGVQERPYGDNFRTFDRVMDRLCALGLARPYVHGGYEITDAGRAEILRLVTAVPATCGDCDHIDMTDTDGCTHPGGLGHRLDPNGAPPPWCPLRGAS